MVFWNAPSVYNKVCVWWLYWHLVWVSPHLFSLLIKTVLYSIVRFRQALFDFGQGRHTKASLRHFLVALSLSLYFAPSKRLHVPVITWLSAYCPACSFHLRPVLRLPNWFPHRPCHQCLSYCSDILYFVCVYVSLWAASQNWEITFFPFLYYIERTLSYHCHILHCEKPHISELSI